jgi:cell wall-associated NlpC family hydrolase
LDNKTRREPAGFFMGKTIMPVPIWAGRYIGLPFLPHGRDRDGVDCWGLVRLVYAEQFGISLPSMEARYCHGTDRKSISSLINRESGLWRIWKTEEACTGDVIVLRLHGLPLHVGLVLGDGQMLHVERGIDSSIESYDGGRWAARVYGVYSYGSKRQHDIFG